jgi:hypothetical protein
VIAATAVDNRFNAMKNPLFCCCSTCNDNVVVEREQNNSDEAEERACAESVYHDARQSMTPSMLYRPATTAPTLEQATFQLDTAPEQLLFSNRSSVRDSMVVVRRLLLKPQQQPQKGYPGDLTQEELDACLDFRKQLKEKRDEEPSYYEMVYCYHGVEDEASALCRFMRARKFVVSDTFDMMQGNLDTWKDGKSHDFYPDVDAALGCPVSVFLTQFPLLHYGISKSGALVSYFQVSTVSLQALDCLTDLENIAAFIWHEFMYGFKEYVPQVQKDHPNTAVRCEMTFVIDLKNIPRSLFTERVMSVLKECCNAFNCFPEILNKMVIVNAPFFFSALWIIIRKFLDARTVAKIDIYSNETKGLTCISEQVSQTELLSDYGGNGPSFDAILQELRPEGTSRQVVERFFLDPHGTHEHKFTLSSTEKAAVDIYTRSIAGASFTLSKSQETVAQVNVKQNEEGNIEPYSRVLASDLKGPGNVTVAATSNSDSNEYFIVIV